MSATEQLELFARTLPRRPYATDDFTRGLYTMPRVRALERRYIQANGPTRVYWLPFDVDRPGGAHDWQLREAPAPNIAVENRENGHAHLLYGLAVPLQKTAGASMKALRYGASVEQGLRAKLGADPSYSGFTVKNPLHPDWHVIPWQDDLYDLDWLADYVDLAPYHDGRRHLPEYGLGRNCTLFENLRRWSYRAIRVSGWPPGDQWSGMVLGAAMAMNTFDSPLPQAEVRATAKSVARWTAEHFTPGAFSARQAARAAVLNVRKRREAEDRRQGLLDFMAGLPDGLSLRAVARMHGTPWSSAQRLLRGGRGR